LKRSAFEGGRRPSDGERDDTWYEADLAIDNEVIVNLMKHASSSSPLALSVNERIVFSDEYDDSDY